MPSRPKSRASGTILLLVTALLSACTSMSTAPPPAELPRFAFVSLHGAPLRVSVFDQRAGDRDEQWARRVESDLTKVLISAGVQILPGAERSFEVRLLRARSDFENRQWNGCVQLSGRVVPQPLPTSTNGEACVAKANLWGKGTADNVLRLAYEDAMVKMLSAMDAQLSN